jgi:HAD domain in Swiss Army Knife RNA repair proteins
MQPKEAVCREKEGSDAANGSRPLLMIDVDGVISLFGALPSPAGSPAATPADPSAGRPAEVDGSFHSIEGIPHFLSSTAAAHLLDLAPLFDLVWCTGWEEKANEHLPHLLGLPRALPFLRFSEGVRGARVTKGHWKLEAIEAYAAGRPLAWIDDVLGEDCHAWAAARPAPTLLVQTVPEHGLTSREARLLADWAGTLRRGE